MTFRPANATAYYNACVTHQENAPFNRDLTGKDDAGRRVYQKSLCGELYGKPRALLTYTEFKQHRKQMDATGQRNVHTQVWTTPYWRNY